MKPPSHPWLTARSRPRLKLVLEPIFEADFLPVSYGFRPERRGHDAIAEIHRFGTKGYHWVLDADIEAGFDDVSHRAVMDAVRKRVKDKRVLALVKAFLKSGILSEDGQRRDTHTGTPQGGILSPLIFNIALSALDEHLHREWLPGGQMDGQYPRRKRRRHGLPNCRIVRYADLCRRRHNRRTGQVANSPGRCGGAATADSNCPSRFSIAGEVLVQHRERDVGQQWR